MRNRMKKHCQTIHQGIFFRELAGGFFIVVSSSEKKDSVSTLVGRQGHHLSLLCMICGSSGVWSDAAVYGYVIHSLL